MAQKKTKAGDLIEITDRKCGKLQPNIKVGDRFIVKELDTTKDGSMTLVCGCKNSTKGVVRINESRFSWKEVSTEQLHDERLNKQTAEIIDAFSREDKVRIGIVPLLYNELAWLYADKAIELGKTYRVEILKKLARVVREKKRQYDKYISQRLDNHHMKIIESGAKRFTDQFATDLMILQLSLSEQFANRCPDYPYRDLRTTALMSKLMVTLADRQNEMVDDMIEKKLGFCKRKKRMPEMESLYICMEAMGGDDGKLSLDDSRVQLSLKVLQNRMNQVEFTYID